MVSAKEGQQAPQSLVKLRDLASQILAQVYNTKDTLEESVNQVLSHASAKTFQDFDRSWLFDICSGVLRYRGRVDYIIDTYSLKKKPAGALRRFLEIGVFQLLAQDVRPALVVSESVQAIRTSEGEAPSKFANALLRKVADSRADWIEWKITESSPFEEQVAWCSLPEWLFKRLRKERGSQWLFKFSEATLERPRTWYRTETEMIQLEKGYQGNEPLGFVQDISNQKLVEESVELIRERFKSTPKILDLCSAPGGKSLGLALSGFSVDATDSDVNRLQRVIENRSKLIQFAEKITIRDYDSLWISEEKFNVIWIDAPCSSVGIIRRHPEIKWNRTALDIERLVLKQQELIEWATKHLSERGIIIFSTCSLMKIENTIQNSSLQSLKELEWSPGVAPYGDGIHAVFLQKTGI